MLRGVKVKSLNTGVMPRKSRGFGGWPLTTLEPPGRKIQDFSEKPLPFIKTVAHPQPFSPGVPGEKGAKYSVDSWRPPGEVGTPALQPTAALRG